MRLSSAVANNAGKRVSPVVPSAVGLSGDADDEMLIGVKLKSGWTAHVNKDGRLYYCNHGTQTASWLPPTENWRNGNSRLPYGWEVATDKDGKSYFINHVNKTTTYEDPRKEIVDEPPQPRQVELIRDPDMGFGFVAGSEKPVVVRFVTDGGPSVDKLLPGDEILKINGEEVRCAPREHVIELVRSCKRSVCLTVCQPHTTNSTRKSAILSAAKKAKLKSNPSRVRFAEGVVINGSPLVSPSSYSTESCIPFMPNVLKVFLENGQTKSFKYDGSTTIYDVLESLKQKLSIKCIDYFSLVVEHIKSLRRNKLTLLDPKESLARIAARPGAQHLRCLFRVTFVPKDAYDLLRVDPVSFEYLYVQCCNDVIHERFTPELKYEITLRLAALHIQQHALTNNIQGKLSVKTIERECGLERFVPLSLLETMKRRELRKLLGHFLKTNQNLSAPGQKHLSALQAKLHYLKIVAELPSYGAKCFTTANLRDSNLETIILVSPKFGISQIPSMRNSVPLTLAEIEDLRLVFVIREDELCHRVELQLKNTDAENIVLSLEDRDAEELVLLLQGYYHLLTDKELPVHQERDRWADDAAPPYHTQHKVQADEWSYSTETPNDRNVDLSMSPTYKMTTANGHVGSMNMNKDKNMNNKTPPPPPPRSDVTCVNKNGGKINFNATSVVEWDEKSKKDDNQEDLVEAKNDQVIRRVAEMQQIVNSAENYLTGREGTPKVEVYADQLPQLRAADSLLLLNQVGREAELEVSGSDTDSVSTPTDSPSRLLTDSNARDPSSQSTGGVGGSSFGLHSPDNIPPSMHKANLQELLRRLQTENHLPMPYPFAEGTLYLDPDIIDLTMIPPPMTPDREGGGEMLPFAAVSMPPTPFADRGSLEAELRALEAHFHQEALELQKDIQADQNRVKNISDPSASPPPPPKGWRSGDIEHFIAAVSVPPPPEEKKDEEMAQLGSLNFPVHSPVVELTPEDISAFIIPPPPASSSSESDCEMIARLQEAAESVKEVVAAPGTTPGVRRKVIGQQKSTFHLQSPPQRSTKFGTPSTPEALVGDYLSSGYETQASSVVSSIDIRDLPGHEPRNAQLADDASTISEGSSSGNHGDAEDEGVEGDGCSNFKRNMSLPRSYILRREGLGTTSPETNQKPPLPPHQESPKKSSPRRLLVDTHKFSNGGGQPPVIPKPVLPLPRSPLPINGQTPTPEDVRVNGTDITTSSQVYSFVLPPEDDVIRVLGTDAPLQKAEVLIGEMMTRLDHVVDSCGKGGGDADKNKLLNARDSLVTEARRFVTASKLFVKSVAEDEAKLTNNLGVCVALLDRMLRVTEILAINTSSPLQTQNVTLKVRDVAATYVQTTRAAAMALGRSINDPSMNALMQHATTLAAVLTALMRTLRAFNP